MATMLAARIHRARGSEAAEDVRIDEVAVPRPGPDDVLVAVRAAGICASDLHVVQGVTPHGEQLPQVLGHEIAGVVESVGAAVTDWSPGDRVAVQMLRPCGACGACRSGHENVCASVHTPGVDSDGGQAEFTVVPSRYLVRVPDTVALDQAAILTDAVATPFHALRRAGVSEGMTCAVFGLGGLGMHAVRLAKLLGAWVIGVDLDPRNLERAKEWGADAVVDAGGGRPHRDIRQMADGGVDRALEFVGNPVTIDQAAKSLRTGGRAVIVGLTPAPINLMPGAVFVAGELELAGSFGSTRQDLEEVIGLTASGDLDLSRSITHRWDIHSYNQALKVLETRDEHPIRMVVTYPG